MTLVLLDLGGVLVDFAGFAGIAPLLPAPLPPAAIRDRWIASPLVRDFELGAMSPAAFAEALVAEWALRTTPEAFLASFRDWLRGPYPGAESFVRALRARHRVACFSNSNAVHWAALAPVAAWFDDVFVSFRLGALKPDAAAFEAVLRASGVAAHDVLFIDDTPANVDGARAVGIRAERADGVEGARAAVVRAGLLAGSCL